MNAIEYSFRVIRYVHDPSVGEALNVGVLVYAPTESFFDFRFEATYSRLSAAFVNFDGENYKRYIGRMETALHHMAEQVKPRLALFTIPSDLTSLTRQVFHDTGGSFQPGEILGGITNDLAAETEIIFDRMVASQYRRDQKTRRNDDDVWSVYQRSLSAEVRVHLKEKTFDTGDFETTFPHTFKNGLWHVLEPVSMDYVEASTIQKKAVDWLGNALALQSHAELGKVYLLLGAPQNEKLRRSYSRAKDLLHKMPVTHEIIEENEAADFAHHISDYMREHGVIPK